MSKSKRAPRKLSSRTEIPFDTAEQAWMWYAQCQVARFDGARCYADENETARPCDPDDIYRVVKRLYRLHELTGAHLKALFGYGLKLMRPDNRVASECGDARRWDEALRRLTPYLTDKGIVI